MFLLKINQIDIIVSSNLINKFNEIDFELSTCECSGLIEFDMSYYKNKVIYTSCAFEFLDQIFSNYKSLDCFLELIEGKWRFNIIDFS